MGPAQLRKALLGLAQRIGSTRLGVLAIGRVFSPLQRWLYRTTGGRMSLTGRAPVLLLTTTIWPAYQAFYDGGGRRSLFVLEAAPSA